MKCVYLCMLHVDFMVCNGCMHLCLGLCVSKMVVLSDLVCVCMLYVELMDCNGCMCFWQFVMQKMNGLSDLVCVCMLFVKFMDCNGCMHLCFLVIYSTTRKAYAVEIGFMIHISSNILNPRLLCSAIPERHIQ